MTDSSSLSSMIASSNHEEQDVEVSLARMADEALLGGIASTVKLLLLTLDHLLLEALPLCAPK
jgi:hypothetical protein